MNSQPAIAQKNQQEISRACCAVMLLGTQSFQVSALLAGLIVAFLVYRDHPNTDFGLDRARGVVLASIIVSGLIVRAVAGTRAKLKTLRHAELVPCRLLKVTQDNSGEDTEYQTVVEYEDGGGDFKTLKTVRRVNSLAVGQTFPLLINRQLQVAILEPDLPGGIRVANLYGTAPIPRKFWLRILLVPLLLLPPLFGLVPAVSLFAEQTTAALGLPVIYWWPIVLQLIWFTKNRTYFSSDKTIPLEDADCKCNAT